MSQFSTVAQSCPTLCDPMNRWASLSIMNSQSSLKLMPIELVMPSSHLILFCPLLLLPLIPPSISVFSSVSTLRIRWPKYCSFSFSLSPSMSEYVLMTCLRIFVYNSSTQKQPLALATVCGQYVLHILKLNIIRLLCAGDWYIQWHRWTCIY